MAASSGRVASPYNTPPRATHSSWRDKPLTDADASIPPRGGSIEARRVGFTLARHRERHRVALDALAEWSAIPVDRLITFEGGSELPTRRELEHLVNAFTRVSDGPSVDVRTLRAELLRLGGYSQPGMYPRRGAPLPADS